MQPTWPTDEEGQLLLRIARQTLGASLNGEQPPLIPPQSERPGLWLTLGAFVTLHQGKELRGCIGDMSYKRPLHAATIHAACAAAFEDPRFFPLTVQELKITSIEVSVISPPEPIAGAHEFDPTQHGVEIELNAARAVFLPQVAREYGWGREETLQQLCAKAGLYRHAWRDPQMKFQIFWAKEFSE